MSVPPSGPVPEDPSPEEHEGERRSARPLVWLLLLIALLAILWYAYSEREPASGKPGPEAPVMEPVETEEAPADTPAEEPESASPAPAPAPAPAPTPAPPDDRGAEPVARVQPDYPPAALRSREEGTVLLRVEVDARGIPVTVDIERSSRSRELDSAARDAVSQWTFRPAIKGGQAVASTVTVPVDFRIE